MIKINGNIAEAKQFILKLKQKNVKVTINLGRNKTAEFIGKLSGVYPALFTVTPFNQDFKGKTSYSYSEYLCGRVKLVEIKG